MGNFKGFWFAIIIVSIIFALPIFLLLVVIASIASINKQEPATPKQTKGHNYDKIFPHIFTDENSSDSANFVEDAWTFYLLTKDDKNKKRK